MPFVGDKHNCDWQSLAESVILYPANLTVKAVFFGTPGFSIASIRALELSTVEVAMVVTQPARRAGRGRSLKPTPVAEYAADTEVNLIVPQELNADAVASIEATGADVYVVVAYGKFIPDALLQVPELGVVNVHPSLLPRHRGPSPVATAMLEGDECTGVSVMQLDSGMDTGPILAQSDPVPIGDDMRCDELTQRLFEIGAEMLPNTLAGLQSGEILPRPQVEVDASVTKSLRKEDGRIAWNESAQRLVRMNRAFHPWPGTFTSWHGQLLKIVDLRISDSTAPIGAFPSTVFRSSDGKVCVSVADGAVELVTIQLAGRRAIAAEQFAIGYPEFVGSQLGE